MIDPYRVLVIEDDLDVALYTKTVLEKRGGCEVLAVTDPSEVPAAMESLRPDVVITDIEMPGASGLDLIGSIREQQPGTPVIVITAHVSVEYAVSALRNQADEFLTKPVASADLVATVARLAEAVREARAKEAAREVVLAIGAHPDDVEIGVGGILAAHRAAGGPRHHPHPVEGRPRRRHSRGMGAGVGGGRRDRSRARTGGHR